jgi:hypothetical protein
MSYNIFSHAARIGLPALSLTCVSLFPSSIFVAILRGVSSTVIIPLALAPVRLIFAPALLVLLAAAVIIGFKKGAESKAVLAIYCLCFVTVVILGFFGGQLVYGLKAPTPPADVKAVAELFSANCKGCHPNGGNIIKPSLPLRSAPQLADFKSFEGFIRDPKMPDGSAGVMPAFTSAKISAQQAKELYDYIGQVIMHPVRK